jgi:PHD/YefM family antitoxin component YafN of YafNO toxin-antitoxin module
MAAWIDITEDTQSLAIFRENAAELIEQLETTHRAITLTVDGQPKAILQNPAAYQRLLDLAAASDASEGIRQGLAELSQGEGRPAAEFFAEVRERHGIPR